MKRGKWWIIGLALAFIAAGVGFWRSRDVPAFGEHRTYDLGAILVEFQTNETKENVGVTVTNKSGHKLVLPREPEWYLLVNLADAYEDADPSLVELVDVATLPPGGKLASVWDQEFLPKFAWLPLDRYHSAVRELAPHSSLLTLPEQRF